MPDSLDALRKTFKNDAIRVAMHGRKKDMAEVFIGNDQIAQLYRDAGITPQQGLRIKGTDAEERGLPQATNAEVLAAMAAEPKLIERPLVETDKGARLCRPQDKVLEIL